MKLVGIEKTMIIPLLARYSESIKNDGVIKDYKAIEIVDKMKLNSDRFMNIDRPQTKLVCITRTWNCDLELEKIMERENETTVISIGCGLDTTYYRSKYDNCNWYDIDLENVINIRKEIFGENEKTNMIAKSILDEDVFKDIEVKGTVVVIALGLFYYFTEDEVKVIIDKISNISSKATIIFDYFSKEGIKVVNNRIFNNKKIDLNWHADGIDDILKLHKSVQIRDNYLMFTKVWKELNDEQRKLANKYNNDNINSMAIIEVNNK